MDEVADVQLPSAASADPPPNHGGEEVAVPVPVLVPAAVLQCRRRVCLVGRAAGDARLAAAARSLGAAVLLCPAGEPPPPPQPGGPLTTHAVLADFNDPLLERLLKANCRVIGPTALLDLAEQADPDLPDGIRPLYSLSMKGCVICFTGFRKKEELTHLITLIHNMGGSVRKDMSARVTHLIANCAGGDKYRYATAFRVPVVGRQWVDQCWEQRDNIHCRAGAEALVKEHKLKVFLGSRICFVGFSEEECLHMADILVNNGGETSTLDDPICSHVVVANGDLYDHSPPSLSSPAHGTPTSQLASVLNSSGTQMTPNSHFNKILNSSGTQMTPNAHFNKILNSSGKKLTPSAQLTRILNSSGTPTKSQLTKTLNSSSMQTTPNAQIAKIFNISARLTPSGVRSSEASPSRRGMTPVMPIEINYKFADFDDSKCSFLNSEKLTPELKIASTDSDDSLVFNEYSRVEKQSDDESAVLKNGAPYKVTDCLGDICSSNLGNHNIPSSPYLMKVFSSAEKHLDLPSMDSLSDLNSSTQTSSSKKRSRNSAESNFEVEIATGETPHKVAEENNWKSPFKKLKIKDSFRFKGKDKPVILKKKKSKNEHDYKVDDVDSTYMTSTPSPHKDDDNLSICSVSSNLKTDRSFFSSSGLFDISLSSLRSSRTAKSVSKIRRSMKSLTASFRGERKKKYEKRPTKESESDDEEVVDGKTKDLGAIAIDISPVEGSRTPLARISELAEMDSSGRVLPSSSSPVIFKTPLSKARRAAPSPLPSAPRAEPRRARTLPSVVDDHSTQSFPDAGPKAQVVKVEWFWASVQNEEALDEKDYLFEDFLESQASPSRRSSRGSCSSNSPPRSPAAPTQRIRKRKLRTPGDALHKRRSSVGDAVLLSLSQNLLDCTQSPDGKQSILDEVECVSVSDAARKHMSPRQQVFMELLQTESNYVGILHTIVTVFKKPLEEEQDNECTDPLLNNTELKIIFGNLPPIYEIHRRMLDELKWTSHNWSEETSIGRIVLKYAPDLVKAYPPFVNFFENMKDMLVQCDREKPRFHAFLKIKQSKPECGRQSLQELLIRPVQRLPSISLLLDDILKHTGKSNPDHSALEKALAGVREVMAHVNEDKRKTEGQLQMFDIYNEIDNCPPDLVSSHRSFVSRCEVMELSKDLSGRGDHLVLFLFTDVMEVCKRRSKVFNSKSPPLNGLHHAASRLGSGKPYRHVHIMPLSTVKRVVDLQETDECHNMFALMCRSNQELKEKLYSFTITDETVDKMHFLKQLCRQMANTVCKADADKFLASLDSNQLGIDTSDIALGTLSKAFKFASRTRLKVGRAFSFNKTPSKLKRAMSSMISPFGSTSNLTPASQLAQMRLASCNNINELGVTTNAPQPEVLVAPMSVQPTRKAKAASLSAGALRRL